MSLRITLIGQLSVNGAEWAPGDHHIAIRGTHGRVALARLLLQRGSIVDATELAETVWTDDAPGTWRAALRNLVTAIRRALDSCPPLAGSTVIHRDGGYQLDTAVPVAVDVELAAELRLAAEKTLLSAPAASLENAATARSLLQGVFLPGATGRWVDGRRQRFAGDLIRLLLLEAEAAMSCDRYPVAIHAAESVVAVDPFQEKARRLLIRARHADGDPAGAQQVYHHYRDLLARELGIDPSPAMTDAYLAVIRSQSVPVRTASSAAEPSEVDRIRNALDALDPNASTERHALLVALSDRLFRDGAVRVATRVALEAVEIAQNMQDGNALASAVLLFGGYYAPWIDENAHDILALLREALELLGEDDLSLKAQLESRFATWSMWSIPRSTRRRQAEEAKEFIRAHGDRAALISVLTDDGFTPPERIEEVRRSAAAGHEMLSLRTPETPPENVFFARTWIAQGQLLDGDLRTFDASLAQMDSIAQVTDGPWFRWRVIASRAMLATVRGDLGDSERLIDQALVVGRGQNDFGVEGIHLSQRLMLRWSQGRAREMVTAVEHMAQIEPTVDWTDLLAWIYAESGQVAAGRRLLAKTDPDRFRSDAPVVPWVHWATSLFGFSHACALLGDPGWAGEVYDIFAGQEPLLLTSDTVCCWGSLDHALALLAGSAGRTRAAAAHRERARAEYRRINASHWADSVPD